MSSPLSADIVRLPPLRGILRSKTTPRAEAEGQGETEAVKTPGKELQCPCCSQTFKNKAGLLVHQRARHAKDDLIRKKMTCSICSRKFKNSNGLRAHQRSSTSCRGGGVPAETKESSAEESAPSLEAKAPPAPDKGGDAAEVSAAPAGKAARAPRGPRGGPRGGPRRGTRGAAAASTASTELHAAASTASTDSRNRVRTKDNKACQQPEQQPLPDAAAKLGLGKPNEPPAPPAGAAAPGPGEPSEAWPLLPFGAAVAGGVAEARPQKRSCCSRALASTKALPQRPQSRCKPVSGLSASRCSSMAMPLGMTMPHTGQG
eukprot:CAMPEP_0203865624 /NCGR_PEP_ID=MMETSP0359-20131031/15461_1 /ASSEMBLY_ACC=CAM_ASM_000338 /TAXON_ID=268821 /ORGANISM="Scrippsiella Hangoei, Strain SHTV-5" /LENGTH=316 /DNA_ID=CAMNT_0050783565 /DNA_START=29 /DNA_END=976 /DNA_ORIENTATION=+